MICCLYGRYSCCNPGAKQAPYYNSTQSEAFLLNNNHNNKNEKKLKSIKSNVYAMFEIAQFDGDLTMSGLTLGEMNLILLSDKYFHFLKFINFLSFFSNYFYSYNLVY
jgi:hypothetical protein